MKLFTNLGTKAKSVAQTSAIAAKKHAPLGLTVAGIVGLGVTAYLTYKARPEIEVIVDEMEDKRANNEPIDKVDVAMKTGKALLLPATVGIASALAIYGAYHIQNNRIKALSGALAIAADRFNEARKRSVDMIGEEETQKIFEPLREEVRTDENGEEQVVTVSPQEPNDMKEVYFSKSSEYVEDDMYYNLSYVEAASKRLENRIFQTGMLTLNQLRQELGFPKIKQGDMLYWTDVDFYIFHQAVGSFWDEKRQMAKDDVRISWPMPKYLYA